jgi:hypothetical protein
MPNSLDVAKQRKLLEDLQRDGQNTQDAETRLRNMLAVIASLHGYGTADSKRFVEKNGQQGSGRASRSIPT